MYQWNKKQAIDKTNKVKSGFFENICKIDKKSYLEKTKITTNIRLEREDITTDPTEVTG